MTEAASRAEPSLDNHVTYESVRDFLYLEARLLDQRKFEEWNELFTPDGKYWIPLAADQHDPINHLSLVYEDAMMRQVRINRLRHDRAWSQQPASRTSHAISCIVIEAVEDHGERIVVGSSFHMSEWRNFGQRTFAGLATHQLLPTTDGYRILEKRVDLINSGDAFEPIEVFI